MHDSTWRQMQSEVNWEALNIATSLVTALFEHPYDSKTSATIKKFTPIIEFYLKQHYEKIRKLDVEYSEGENEDGTPKK